MNINRIIKTQETYVFKRFFPVELKRFLKDRYSDDGWPYGYEEESLHDFIRIDAVAYFEGKLDTTIKTPNQKLQEENQYLREQYCDAMCEISDLNERIDKLYSQMQEHGLEPSNNSIPF